MHYGKQLLEVVKVHYKQLSFFNLGLCLVACSYLDEPALPSVPSVPVLSEIEGMMKLGRQLENPYSVENMKKARDNITASGRVAEDVEITTTHLYLKFLPKNEAEMDVLQTDSTLVLYDYPLDFEIEERGDFYRDPSVPAGQPTYQYGAVGVRQPLPPGIAYELLAKLFIPDEFSDAEGPPPVRQDARCAIRIHH